MQSRIVSLLITFVFVGVGNAADINMCGDVNASGEVTATDALLVLHEATGVDAGLMCRVSDFSGADLSGKDLAAVDLAYSNLERANLSQSNLSHANLVVRNGDFASNVCYDAPWPHRSSWLHTNVVNCNREVDLEACVPRTYDVPG